MTRLVIALAAFVLIAVAIALSWNKQYYAAWGVIAADLVMLILARKKLQDKD